MLRAVLEPTDPPIQWVPEDVQLEHEGESLLHCSAKVKNECCHAFIARTERTL